MRVLYYFYFLLLFFWGGGGVGGVGASHIEIPRDFPSQLRRQESNQGITIPPATQARLS